MELFQKEKDIIKRIKNGISWLSVHRSDNFLPVLIFRIGFFYIVARLLHPLLKVRAINKNKTIISCRNTYFTGNSKAVFEYLQKKSGKIEAYWIADNLHTFKKLRKKGVKAFYKFSTTGMSYFINTDIWVRSHTAFGESQLLPHNNSKSVQLWHGIGPKAISHSQEDYELFDAWCVASEFSKQRHIKLWNAPPEKLFVTGFARMDKLHNYLKIPKEKLLREIGIKNSTKKVILYAPTYDVGLWPWENCYEEFEKFCKFCKEKNLILILRLHPFAKIDKKRLKIIISKNNNVFWLDMCTEPDTMKLLATADILITDWSSIYTDYFLTKRPIIYLEVNKVYYTKTRGKPEIPPEYRAGEIAHNTKEVYDALKIVFETGNRFRTEQEKLLKTIHGEVDGKASERCVKEIINLIKKNNGDSRV